MAKKKTDLPPHVITIKNFCKLLSSYDIDSIQASYDGSGDSGDMSISVQKKQRTPLPAAGPINATTTSNTDRYEWLSFNVFAERVIKEPNTLITAKSISDFEDALYDFLPGGWEINDGSYGEISINVSTGSILVDHYERIVDVNHSSKSYE